MFSRAFLAFLVAALAASSASAARPAPAQQAVMAQPAAAGGAAAAAPQAAVAAAQTAAYEKAVAVTDADRAAAAPIISFLKKIPQPPGACGGLCGGVWVLGGGGGGRAGVGEQIWGAEAHAGRRRICARAGQEQPRVRPRASGRRRPLVHVHTDDVRTVSAPALEAEQAVDPRRSRAGCAGSGRRARPRLTAATAGPAAARAHTLPPPPPPTHQQHAWKNDTRSHTLSLSLSLSTQKHTNSNTAQVLAAASKALSLTNPSTGSTISAPDAAASAFGSVTSFAQKTVEGAASDPARMPEAFKQAAANSQAWAAGEQAKADAAAAKQVAANARGQGN
jgi:trimeric autotransporter adhesin